MYEAYAKYQIANSLVLALALYFLLQFIRKKYKCLLYIGVALATFSVSFYFLGNYFINYSGVVLIAVSIFALFSGRNDWNYLKENKTNAFQLFFADRLDYIISTLILIGIPLSVIIAKHFQ